MHKRLRNERGAAMIEAAVIIPLVMLVSVAIFEFGRAYQHSQVITNAAREGARVAVLEAYTDDQVKTIVLNYMTSGSLMNVGAASINITRNVPFMSNTASRVTVDYPFQFMLLNPIARMVRGDSSLGTPLTMHSTALMRNE